MNTNSKLFELLCQNDKDKIKDFILDNGKGPKPKCPVEFINQEDNDNGEQIRIRTDH